jgi:mxaK protein
MGLTSRRTTRWVLALGVLLLAAAAVDALRLWRTERLNQAIAAGQPPAEGSVPELRFAQAYALAASGAGDAALNHYRPLQGEDPLGQAARFNSANLLLRQAMALREGSQPGQAVPLIELAKETYREVLRNQPQHWPARYNLERAQRLLPDPEDLDGGPLEVPRNAERAATTMRGYSPGLP